MLTDCVLLYFIHSVPSLSGHISLPCEVHRGKSGVSLVETAVNGFICILKRKGHGQSFQVSPRSTAGYTILTYIYVHTLLT